MTFTKSLLACSAICAATFTATGAPIELVTDAGFEVGPVNNGWNNFTALSVDHGEWYAAQYEDRLSWKASGGNTGRYLGQATEAGGATVANAFYQSIALPPSTGGDYTISFDYLNFDSGLAGDNPNLFSWGVWGFTTGDLSAASNGDLFQYGNALGNTVAEQPYIPSANLLASGSFAPGNTSGWASLTPANFTETTGFDQIVIGFGVDELRPGFGDQIGFDNVSLTFVPEPSSLALLGLGGLLIARRRRD